ncbi:MAG TPA: Flp pilus assembly protein CpaB [Acidimicrobiia bacterium]|nr:Flp pilus assembly protein CpaB [Acidimicrobiia bacterium]
MSNRRTLMAAAAIVLAAVAGIGVYLYASNADNRAADNAHFVNALVATSDIAKGTTGEEAIQAGLIAREKVAKSSIPPSIVTNINDLTNKIAAGRIDTKQFITTTTFVSADDGAGGAFANAIARQDLVAVSVNVDAERGVANQIQPGDHVDIATSSVDESGNSTTTYLLQDVKVLAVGSLTVQQQQSTQSSDTASAQTQPTGLLTFEVTSEDALRVIDANNGNSKMYLVLLPPRLGSGGGGTATAATGSR